MMIQSAPKHRLYFFCGRVYRRKDITISLHFLQLSSIPLDDAKWAISCTKIGNRLGEQRGTTSKAVVSSTNLIRALQSFKREFYQNRKKKGSKFGPLRQTTISLLPRGSRRTNFNRLFAA